METSHGEILIAPDSFKGSLSAKEAAEALARGIRMADPAAKIALFPLADGGEGTLDALVPADSRITVTVTGPYGAPVRAQYGISGDTAVLEMARAAGLCLSDERHTADATTYGVGELIRDALQRGIRKVLLTVGGSATTDAGCGMMAALGVRFFRRNGEDFLPAGSTLGEINGWDFSALCPGFRETEFTIAADVTNPLTGPQGTVAVYAPQKGASAEEMTQMEQGMRRLSRLVQMDTGRDIGSVPGCGAAGGLPLFLLAYGGAVLRSGIDTVLEVSGLRERLAKGNAAAVLTGEGKLDTQSLCGKTVSGVVRAAANAQVPVFCFAGCAEDRETVQAALGIRDISLITDLTGNTEDAMQNAAAYLSRLAERWRRRTDIR